jgi:hypothetical protein
MPAADLGGSQPKMEQLADDSGFKHTQSLLGDSI